MTGKSPPGDETLATAPIVSARRVHLPALDGMRGLSILVVMSVHFATTPSDASVPSAAPPALDALAFAFGIQMFFVLSGFLITGILLEAREKPRYFRNYYARRMLRTFPLYYGTLVVLFLLFPSWGHAVGGVSSPRWLWLHLSNWEIAGRNQWSYGYLSHFWSLAVEEQYYLLWPFLVLALRPRWLLAACVVLGVSSFALRIVLTVGWTHLVGAYVMTPCELDPLCAGGALAILVRKWPLARLRPFARASILGAAAAFFLLGWHHHARTSRQQVVGRPLLSCFLFGGILLLAIGESGLFRGFFSARPLTFFGKYSYGLYVLHFPLCPFFARVFPRGEIGRALGSASVGAAAAVLLSILGSLVVAIASYELFEKRFLRLKALFPE